MVKHLLLFFFTLTLTATLWAQTLTTTRVSADDSADPLVGGSTIRVVFGFNIDKGAGVTNLTNLVISTGATDPNSVFSSVALHTSGSNFAAAVNTNATVTLNAGNITFAGNPTNLYSFGVGATNQNFYVVATVRSDVATTSVGVPQIALSFTEAGTTYSTAVTENAFSLTGSTYNFQALIADFTQNADDATAIGDQNGVELMDFTVLSNGASAGQTINTQLVFTFNTDVTNILENWDLQVGGADIPGTEIYTLNGAGTQLTITAFTAVDVSTSKNFQLFADIKSVALSTNDFTISLASTGATATPGVVESFTTFTNSIDVTALTADFTQNADASTGIGDQNGVELLDFTVLSNGSQVLKTSIVFTFNTDVTNILENWDLQVGGADIPGTENYALSGGGTILTVTNFTDVAVSPSKNFQLFADIKAGALSTNDFTITLANSGITVDLGYPENPFTFTNSIDITALTADFTQNADDATALAGQTSVELLDFTVLSNASGTAHTLNPSIVITFNKDVSGILSAWDLRVGGVDIPGGESYTLNGAGTQLTIAAFTNVDITTSKNFQLYADIAGGASVTDDFTITLAEAGVTLSGGFVETFGTLTNSIDIVTSQVSKITLNAGTTASINYIGFRSNILTDNGSNSVPIAGFTLTDGNGTTNDPDGKSTSLTALTVELTNYQFIKKIALFAAGGKINTPVTEQTVTSNTVSWDLSSAPIVANDNGTKDFSIRVTFQNTVTDNQEVHVTITGATALSTGSGFATANAGGVSSSTLSPTNKIDVDATLLAFVNTSLPSTTINTNFALSIRARDTQNNQDLDYTGQVNLTRSPATGTLTAQPGQTVTGATFVAGAYDWTTLRLSQSGLYTLTASDDAYNNDFTDPTATITISSSACTITPGTTSPAIICLGNTTAGATPTAFYSLSNIVITETDPAGISGTSLPASFTFSIALPAGFVFNPNAAADIVTVSSEGDLSAPSGYTYQSSNTVALFSFTLNGTSNINTITLSGLEVGATHPGSVLANGGGDTGILDITRSGGTATISGITPGTVLGSLRASQQGAGTASFSVSALSGNIDPNTTSFNNNSPAVKLVPSPSTPLNGILFTGSGITYVDPDYRFNPSSLSPANYPITFTHTDASGCQTVAQKTFTIYVSGINGLDPAYCSNDAPSGNFSVDPTFINTQTGFPGYVVDHYVYYDHEVYSFYLSIAGSATVGSTYTNNGQTFTVIETKNAGLNILCTGTGAPIYSSILTKTSGTGDAALTYSYYYQGDFRPITSPSNIKFDPTLPAYQSVIKNFGGRIPIGFALCNNGSVPCNGQSNTGTYSTYQWVTVNAAPAVSFSLPSDIYTYCEDAAPLILTGNPANSTNITNDNFTASGGQSASISHSLVGGVEVWSFSPAAVSGVDANTSQTFNITYKYTNVATGCDNTVSKSITVHDRPTAVPSSDITKSTSNPPSPTTTMQLCEGGAVGSFSGTDPTYTYKWYENTASDVNFKGTGSSFTPPINNLVAGANTFQVTRMRNGCESINTPLALTVDVIATPPPPAANRNLSYCVGTSIPDNDLLITTATGTVKWYLANNPTPVFTGSNPTAANLGIVTTTANIYNFELTQVGASGCEGPLLADRTKIRVEIKLLPSITITSSADDLTKICTTGGVISFKATDRGNTAPNGNWSGTGLGGVGVLNPFNTLGITELYPATLSPQTYTLRYDYTDAITLCSNFKTIDFTILPTITPAITIGNVCDGSPALIVNNSQVNQSSSTNSTIQYTEWTLGDGSLIASGLSSDPIPANTNSGRTSGTYLSPKHIYPNVGTFQITGAMTTSDGCRYTFPVPPANIPVTVSPLPKVKFTWKNACRDSLTSTEFTATETSNPPLPLATYTWNFKTQGSLTTVMEGTGATPIVKYNKNGSDSVELIVSTSAGCSASAKKIVYVVPKFKRIVTDTSYFQNFDSGPDSWLTGGENSSWALGTPAGKANGYVFNGDATTGTGNAWDTNLTGPSNQNEQSWVLSQCFNFTAAQKPAISLNIWSDTPQGVEGAVLQYNEDGNVEDSTSWKVLGALGSGVNWYDAQGIASSPGNQSSGDLGWTGNALSSGNKYGGWTNAIYKLDELKGKPNIIFRIAFGGGPGRSDGFAFDNVFIGERSRVVLLENFTNSSAVTAPLSIAQHNNIYKAAGTSAELVKIQYHTPFPGNDPINDLNPQMNNARTAFYGITQAPTMRIDGDYGVGGIISWLSNLYDKQILTPADVRINILTTKLASGEVRVVSEIENISNSIVPLAGAHVFTAVVEKSITSPALLGNSGNSEFVFVAKEFLPSASGKKIPSNLLVGQTYRDTVIWKNLTGDAIVVFVQNIDSNNKNVFQSQIELNPALPNLITAIETILPEQVNVYPNPATREFFVELPAMVQNEAKLHLIDLTGRKFEKGVIPSGRNSATVNVENLSEGIYILEIGSKDTGIIRKKIMVVMKN